MALTNETIKANALLSALTDEQLSAITTLSKNDEDVVIGKRIGEIYRDMDDKISNITGVKREGDEKTYIYLERATTSLKENASKVTDLSKQIDDLTKEKGRLEKTIADGNGDAEIKRQLTQANLDLENIRGQYNTLNDEYTAAKSTHKTELHDLKVSTDIASAIQGIAFKKDIPESATKVLLDQAIAKIKSYNPEYVDNGNNGRVLVYKDKDQAIMRNKENKLEPYTTSELLRSELKTMGVLDDAQKAGGAGTGAGGGTDGKVTIPISGAKTRMEANQIIKDQLLAQGLTVGSDDYQKQMNEAWVDNKISELPEK